MKKVNIATGHSQIIGDYTLQLQDAIADALKGITSAYGDCIISGCVLTLASGTTYNVSEGWLMWGGEVFHLPAQTVNNPSLYPIVVFKSQTTITNPFAYEDGLTKPLATITEVNFKAAAAALSGEAYLTDFGIVAPAWMNNWIGIACHISYFTYSGMTAPSMEYKVLESGNEICIRGMVKKVVAFGTGIPEVEFAQLPAMYLPRNDIWVASSFGNAIHVPNTLVGGYVSLRYNIGPLADGTNQQLEIGDCRWRFGDY